MFLFLTTLFLGPDALLLLYMLLLPLRGSISSSRESFERVIRGPYRCAAAAAVGEMDSLPLPLPPPLTSILGRKKLLERKCFLYFSNGDKYTEWVR
jgi:hypothetical protein